MIQNILILLIFICAAAYLGRMLFLQFTAKSNCDTGCGKCNAVDFDKIEKQIKAKSTAQA